MNRLAHPGSHLRRAALPALWVGLALVAFGFLAARARWRASVAGTEIEARIAAVGEETRRGRALDAATLGADVEALRAEIDALSRRVPCGADGRALAALLRERLGGTGHVVRDDLGWIQERAGLGEIRIPIVPPPQGDVDAARRALAAEERLFVVAPGEPGTLVVTAFHQLARDCAATEPQLPRHDAPVPWREDLSWPFERRVEAAEQRLRDALAERDAVAGALRREALAAELALRRDRLRALVASVDGPARPAP